MAIAQYNSNSLLNGKLLLDLKIPSSFRIFDTSRGKQNVTDLSHSMQIMYRYRLDVYRSSSVVRMVVVSKSCKIFSSKLQLLGTF